MKVEVEPLQQSRGKAAKNLGDPAANHFNNPAAERQNNLAQDICPGILGKPKFRAHRAQPSQQSGRGAAKQLSPGRMSWDPRQTQIPRPSGATTPAESTHPKKSRE
jgi:hypothetical protein